MHPTGTWPALSRFCERKKSCEEKKKIKQHVHVHTCTPGIGIISTSRSVRASPSVCLGRSVRIPMLLACVLVLGHAGEDLANPRPPVLHAMPAMPRQYYQRTPLKNLTVLVVPHSHDDTGWQRSVDQYYEEEVRYIYDSVVAALRASVQRKFIFVETAFFMRWWAEQSDEVRQATRKLFATGQLEFVNGGWCMADDASPTISALIDQTTLGHRYIADTLGAAYVPKNAWHIDPFGLSSSYALAWGAMNYSSWTVNRVDTRQKDLWHNESRLQFHWTPEGAGRNPGVFTHVLDTHYGAPEITYKGTHYHFDWEVFGGLGGGEDPGSQLPVSTSAPSPFYAPTANEEAEAFVAMARLRAGWYRLGKPYQKVLLRPSPSPSPSPSSSPNLSSSPKPNLAQVPDGSGVILVPFGDDMKFQNVACTARPKPSATNHAFVHASTRAPLYIYT